MKKSSVNRRQFVKVTGALAAGFSVMKPETALGMQANESMSIGIIGCGGRGNHDGENFVKFAKGKVTALADPYPDKLESTQKSLSGGNAKLFQGFDGYKKLLETDIDTVIITSPPYFHPEHFAAAVDAGKHIYFEKPISVDTAGSGNVLSTGKKAEGKQTVMVGFQSRFRPDLQWAVKRIREGAIGDLVCGQGHYHSGWLGPRHREDMPQLEQRIRNWLWEIALSGDILVEQNIHVIDVCNWLIGSHPVKAFGTGGRKARKFFGDTWDHYEVIFTYPNDFVLSFCSTQFLDLGWNDAGERINGSKGSLDSLFGPARLRYKTDQEEKYDGKDENAEELKVKAFYESVNTKKYVNEIEQAVVATRTAIMGRTAAFRKTEYTWDEMLKENEKLDAGLKL